MARFVTTQTVSAVTSSLAKDITFPSGAKDTISAVRFSPVSHHLAAASWDGGVYIYDAANSSSIKGVAVVESQSPVLDCHFSKDGAMIASAGADKKIHVYDIASGQKMDFDGHEAPVRCLRFVDVPSANGPIIASGSWDKTVKYWDLRQPQSIATLQCDERVYSMDSAGALLAIAVAGCKIHLVDLRTNPGAHSQTLDSPLTHQTRSVAVSPNGSRWAIGGVEGRVGIRALAEQDKNINLTWRCHRDAPVATGKNKEVKVFAVNDVTFHPTNNNLLATAGSDGTFTFWDIKAHSRIKQFPNVGGSITSVAFNRDASAFAYAVGYDWSKGYSHNSPDYPTKLMMHTVSPHELRK
ncbi:WD40-repeat-containing domain protein [Lasiosphaeria ovina]|uniref:WD40-repeat-containing domain protein n=1 Tax=Lasiosphaeria ovina TaxID=92902 RepID=A0AAE0KN64_9PEZI|nr:WD40-repeat-containing domain protein [Lasiosphaeria ovina]